MSQPATAPAVYIGLPVRNGAASLDAAIASLTSQTHRNLQLLITDNHSEDDTREICEKWAERDSRVRYVRQSQNIGPIRNFHFALQQADAPYFMWAAHDDFWQPEYIAANLSVLESQPKVVCSVSEVELVDVPVLPEPLLPGTAPLRRDPHSNLLDYLQEPGANSRIYGVYRTDVLKRSFLATDDYWAFDWAIVARTLMYGQHALVPRRLMHRRCRGDSSDAERNILRYNRSWVSQQFPMLPFTWAMLVDDKIPHTPAVLKALARWNHIYWKNSVRRFRRRRLYPVLEFLRLRPARHIARPAT